MGALKLPNIKNYLENSFIFGNNLTKIISKNIFKFLCSVLHLPVSDGDKVEIIPINYLFQKLILIKKNQEKKYYGI